MVHLRLHVVLLLCTEALRMFPVTFEKDEGMHIDFIAAASVSHFKDVVPNMATIVSTQNMLAFFVLEHEHRVRT